MHLVQNANNANNRYEKVKKGDKGEKYTFRFYSLIHSRGDFKLVIYVYIGAYNFIYKIKRMYTFI